MTYGQDSKEGRRGQATLSGARIGERLTPWDKGLVTPADRRRRNGHASRLIVFAGEAYTVVAGFAKALERSLFLDNCSTYYLGLNEKFSGSGPDMHETAVGAGDPIRRLGELARILTDSGRIFITALSRIDETDLEMLKMLNTPSETLVICVGSNIFSPYEVDLVIPEHTPPMKAVEQVLRFLGEKEVIIDYSI
jgi:bifunctional enzyme CysN/CysC